jgi:hypothetical protein
VGSIPASPTTNIEKVEIQPAGGRFGSACSSPQREIVECADQALDFL